MPHRLMAITMALSMSATVMGRESSHPVCARKAMSGETSDGKKLKIPQSSFNMVEENEGLQIGLYNLADRQIEALVSAVACAQAGRKDIICGKDVKFGLSVSYPVNMRRNDTN